MSLLLFHGHVLYSPMLLGVGYLYLTDNSTKNRISNSILKTSMLTEYTTLKYIMTSVAEAEIVIFSHNTKTEIRIQCEMGYTQSQSIKICPKHYKTWDMKFYRLKRKSRFGFNEFRII